MKYCATIVILVLIALLAGCGTGVPAPDAAGPASDDGGQLLEAPASPEPRRGFEFDSGGVTVRMGDAAADVVDSFGEPLNYFEAPSCAFDGIDRIYYYRGFEVYTFPVDGVDFISSVNLTDDSVETREGVYLGMSLDDMTAAYGDGFAQNLGQYTYTLGDSSLSFLVENGVLVSITYNYLDTP